MEPVETLVGIAEIAVALAGFTGVVVVFGSRSQGAWHPGDHLRLHFLLEASLTAGGFALLTLLLLNAFDEERLAWVVAGSAWSVFMTYSLYSAHTRIDKNLQSHDDVDKIANRLVSALFMLIILLQVANGFLWQSFAPVLAALLLNLAGAAMQFARLIRSAFRE